MSEIIKFKGKCSKKIFDSESYKIYSIDVHDSKNDNLSELKFDKYGTITVCGDIPTLDVGAEFEFSGILKNSKYGWQYEITNIFRDKPKTEKELKAFLREILTTNQVETLLSAYPNIVDLVINNEPVDLTKTKGIKEYTFNVIKKKIIDNYALLDLVSEYAEYGLTLSMIRKLYQSYTSIDSIREHMDVDPYSCLCKINGIGFITADDKILKIKPHLKCSKQRILSCIEYILDENESNGNTAIDKLDLYNRCRELVPESIEFMKEALDTKDKFHIGESLISNKYTYECEQYVGDIVNKLLDNDKVLDIDIDKYRNIGGFDLTDEQIGSLDLLCKHSISILSGYAGSGKTQTTKAIINMCDENKISYKLLSPTGKAAQVLSGYCERPASTIHRGLGYNPTLGWEYNEDNKLYHKLVIVDEFSMVDIFLLRHLFEAIDVERTRVLFVCDEEQLASVGPGNICYDLINTRKVPLSRLTKIFRYGEGGLMQVATMVRNGQKYIEDDFVGIKNFGVNSDYSLVSIPQEESVVWMAKIIKRLIDNGESIDNICVLTAMNKGDYGTIALNKIIQQIVNPQSALKREIVHVTNVYREGDKVMQIKNNYDAEDENHKPTSVFNGNIGVIRKIEYKYMLVDFEETSVWYEKEDLNQLSLGYCMTIHKSQGSAFDNVIVINPKSHKFFLNKNIIYVALTRARKRIFHLTTPDVINQSIRKSVITKRITFLLNLVLKGVRQC